MNDAGSRLPLSARAHPDHPGWYYWPNIPADSFAGNTGLMIFRTEGDAARVRMFPTEYHLNGGGSIHGGAVMSFIDSALFAGGHCAGMAQGHYVTLDCATHFIARGRPGVPLDAVVRRVGETPGGLVFLSGHCEQDGVVSHGFSGTLKRVRAPVDGDGPAS